MRRFIQAALLAFACTAALLVGPTSAAHADSGDGSTACNNGEICFLEYSGNTSTGLKHFWYGANHWSQEGCQLCHGPYRFWGTGHYVMDNAEDIRNRDTQCRVYVFDVDQYGNWWWYLSLLPQSGQYLDWVDNRNNGHSRCTEAAPKNL